MRKIILASASPRRSELLEQMGFKFKVIVSDVDEDDLENMPPDDLVEALASLKAKAVAKDFPESIEDSLVIGADTIVVLDGQVLGKPMDEEDAMQMLGLLSGKKHIVYTGVSIIDAINGKEEKFTKSSKIYMKEISKEEIEEYVLTKEPLDKAGAYGIQGKGGVFIEKIEGDYFTIVGLPIAELYERLRKYK